MTEEMVAYCKKYNSAEYCDNLPRECYSSPMLPLTTAPDLAWTYFPPKDEYFCKNGCYNGACLPDNKTKQCSEDLICEVGYDCIGGLCVLVAKKCITNTDCHGEICIDGVCVKNQTIYPARDMCTQARGKWKNFTNGCADYCEFRRETPGEIVCTQAITEGCDCGPSMCWTGARCEQNNKTIAACDSGCALNNKCYPMGYRKAGRYCSEDYQFNTQVQGNTTCENNFECKSNLCIDSQCMTQGFMKKFMSWFKSFNRR
jgi:hypothetical protein